MPRANVKDKRKAELIAATIDSIGKRGLQETTITHISKGAGMSRGIINFYFTSKEAMLRETLRTLVDDYTHGWGEVIAEEKKIEGAAALEALVAAHFSKKLCSAKRLNVMSAFWGHAASHAAYRELLQASDARIESAFANAWKQAGIPAQDAPQVARQTHALIRGSWLAFMLSGEASDRDRLAAQCQAFVAERLQKAAGQKAEKPQRRVNDKPAPVAEKVTAIETLRGAAKPAKPKEKAPAQMDIEDLFAGLR
jgi:TetR/AcrR family transcriptional repressor of bet genes